MIYVIQGTTDQKYWSTKGITKHRRFAYHIAKVIKANTTGEYANIKLTRVLEVPEEEAWQFGYTK